jgi:hypothetical protein
MKVVNRAKKSLKAPRYGGQNLAQPAQLPLYSDRIVALSLGSRFYRCAPWEEVSNCLRIDLGEI